MSEAMHPEWRVGQYVTYFLERSDANWAAFAITIEAQTEDGAWILRGDFKTRRGDSTMWFRSNPHAKADEIDPRPISETALHSSAETVEEFFDEPFMQDTLATNLLQVRRAWAAVRTLQSAPRPVRYPCGIDSARRFTSRGPGYDLNPRVFVTGVACVSGNDGQNPMIATSFGSRSPSDSGTESYEDFVDFSHCKVVRHNCFSLSYPATWFLRLEGSRHDRGATVDDYSAHPGGVTCACTFAVSIGRGTHKQLTEIRQQALARFAGPITGPMGMFIPQPSRSSSQDGRNSYFFQLANPGIDGLAHVGVLMDASGTTLAQVCVFGCVGKDNPRRQQTLREMDDVFPDIVNSFQFVTNEAAV